MQLIWNCYYCNFNYSDTPGDRSGKVYPKECRIRRISYRGKLDLTLDWWMNGIKQEPIKRTCGEIPIMVKSLKCNLYGLDPEQLVERGEEMEEFGGYFVVNGNEKVRHMKLLELLYYFYLYTYRQAGYNRPTEPKNII